MSAFGPKRTSLFAAHMSAFGGKADRARLLLARPNKIRHLFAKYLPSKSRWEDHGKTQNGNFRPLPAYPGGPINAPAGFLLAAGELAIGAETARRDGSDPRPPKRVAPERLFFRCFLFETNERCLSQLRAPATAMTVHSCVSVNEITAPPRQPHQSQP